MKPLYQAIEERYKDEIEMPELMQKKKRLQELRQLYQPIEKLGIDKHMKDYEITKKHIEEDI